MIAQIIVVEGRDDTRRLQEVLGAVDTIETNGSAVSAETLALIAKAHATRGVIVLTDPDFPGQKIRQTITAAVPTVGHAFLTVDEALPTGRHRSLGLEHASAAAIKRALAAAHVSVIAPEARQEITTAFLTQCGLVGGTGSGELRSAVCQRLGIGHANGKRLAQRLMAFNISEQDVRNVLQEIQEETSDHE